MGWGSVQDRAARRVCRGLRFPNEGAALVRSSSMGDGVRFAQEDTPHIELSAAAFAVSADPLKT